MRRALRCAYALALLATSTAGFAAAMQVQVGGAVTTEGTAMLKDHARLSDAALAARPLPTAYMLGAAWLRPSLLESQQRLKAGILFDLTSLQQHAISKDKPELATLAGSLLGWIKPMPVTGREPALLDPRAVEANAPENHPLADGDRVAVYPKFEALDIRPLLRVRAAPLRELRFVADAHLGGLAQLLRLAGFDTLYDNNFPDDEIEALAASEHRIVLTRDRELLKRRGITHGCYVRTLKPHAQLHEIFERLDLAASARPFRLCLSCNAPLHAIARGEARDRVPEGVFERQARFVTCDVCRRVFWEGSHWRRMRALMDGITRAAPAPGP